MLSATLDALFYKALSWATSFFSNKRALVQNPGVQGTRREATRLNPGKQHNGDKVRVLTALFSARKSRAITVLHSGPSNEVEL